MTKMYIKSDGHYMHISHLLNLIGNNGCGPDSAKDLSLEIEAVAREATKIKRAMIITYAGAYDILVNPSGTFSLVSNQTVLYELVEEIPR